MGEPPVDDLAASRPVSVASGSQFLDDQPKNYDFPNL